MTEERGDEITRLAQLGVATVYEAAGRTGLLDVPLTQILPGSRVAGPARTVRCGQGDNLMVHAVMDHVVPGDVLVLTMPQPEPVALLGELLAIQAQVRQVAAVLVDAAVRDVAELVALGLPVWARYIRVRGATKTQMGTIDTPVEVGGTTVRPGDIVVLDADGAVAIAGDRVAEVVAAADARQDKEDTLRRQLRAGALTYDLHGLRARAENA